MSNRFVEKNAHRLVEYLHSTNLDPEARLAPPSVQFMNGCSDPECCPTHDGFFNGEPMLSVKTRLSNTQLHRIAVELGLVRKRREVP